METNILHQRKKEMNEVYFTLCFPQKSIINVVVLGVLLVGPLPFQSACTSVRPFVGSKIRQPLSAKINVILSSQESSQM